MPHTLYLAPCGAKVGLTSVALGLVRALDNRGVRVAFCKPIGQRPPIPQDPSGPHILSALRRTCGPHSISLDEAERLISSDRTDELMERVMRDFHESSANADVVVVEGLAHSSDMPIGAALNAQLVRTLSAQVILAGSLAGLSIEEFDERLEVAATQYRRAEFRHDHRLHHQPCARPAKAAAEWPSRLARGEKPAAGARQLSSDWSHPAKSGPHGLSRDRYRRPLAVRYCTRAKFRAVG